MPESQPAAEAAKPAPRKRRRGLIAAIAAAVVVAGGAAAWFLVPRAATSHEEPAAGGPAPHAEPVYVSLDPPFVVNFEANAKVRFLQVAVQAVSRDPATADMLKRHTPRLRDALLMLLAGRDYESLATREGKEKLRQAALAEIREVVSAEGGEAEQVEAVYFTSFVMQ